MDAPATFTRQALIPASLVALTRRDVLWLIPCTLSLWLIGVILALDDSGRVFRGNDPSAPTWAACGIVLGVFGIWRWRRWLIRDELLRPAHDSADDVLWFAGAFGAILLYIFIVPPGRLLPPNATLCILAGLAGARLLYSGLTRRVGNTLHCSRCNYHIVDTSLPRRCPECAGVWAHRLVRGRITRSTRLVSAGVLLLFIFTLAPVPRLEISRAFIRRQMSTAWIVSQASESLKDGLVYDADLWRELGKRTLTDQQAQTLADLVLRHTASNTLRDFASMTWLENLVFSGKAPRRAADAFMELSIAFQLSAPQNVYAGRNVPLRIQALELRRLPRDRIAIYLETVTDDDDTTPIVNSGRWEVLSDAMTGRSRPLGTLTPPMPGITNAPPLATGSDVLGIVATPVADLTGIKTYRARLWAAIVAPGNTPPLSPASLAPLYIDPTVKSPVSWLKRFDLQTTVTVRDLRISTPPRPTPKQPAAPTKNP
ncbi:MAG: hypothetical protein KF805_13940 [Phycisphaeraceae bacterium]|nr:hypothetical protein [Phycisphaeraceae bacterium]